MSDISDHMEEIFEVNKANGWFDTERTFGDDIALLHSEVSEMFEAYRDWGMKDMTFTKDKHTNGNPGKPEGVGSEAADIYIRLLDTCRRYGIDLDFEYERKIKHNAGRGYHHGGKLL